MVKLHATRCAALLAITLTSVAGAAEVERVWPAGPPRSQGPGYLTASALPDENVFLPPPPPAGSTADRADLATLKATRALAGSARWALAAHDAAASPQAVLSDFDCALGLTLTPATAPILSRLSSRAMGEAMKVVGAAKDRYRRPRPFLRARGEVCIPTAEIAASGSYPSGHAAAGWLQALILAELAPEHASRLLSRGRAYGESRVVCGVHYPTDVEGGRTVADAVFAALHSSAEFREDMAAARAELGAISATAASNACAVQDAQMTRRPW